MAPDLGLTYMALAEYANAHACISILSKESNWSKATYTYFEASTLCQIEEDPNMTEDQRKERRASIKAKMETVPGYMQKIAGKSLPIEKFVARKSRKYITYDGLVLPGLEMAYVCQALALAPSVPENDRRNRSRSELPEGE